MTIVGRWMAVCEVSMNVSRAYKYQEFVLVRLEQKAFQ